MVRKCLHDGEQGNLALPGNSAHSARCKIFSAEILHSERVRRVLVCSASIWSAKMTNAPEQRLPS